MKKILFFTLFPLLCIGQTQIGSDINGENAGDNSGGNVAISNDGTVVAIGAIYNSGSGANSGHTRVYKNNAGTWSQIGADINGAVDYGNNGFSVSLSGDGSVVATAAPFGSSNSNGDVRVYKNTLGNWVQIGSPIIGNQTYDAFGGSLSISDDGTVIAIGAPYGASGSGYVKIYKNISGTWTQIGATIVGTNTNIYSGVSVTLSNNGNTVAIGATYANDNGGYSGQVKVYQNISGVWTQIGVGINGDSNDFSGSSLSFSSDASILAIAAYGYNSNTGKVRVYQNVSGTWTQIGADIIGEATGDGNASGISVCLSDDGSIIAIGAAKNDGNSTDSGHARIYKNISGTWTQIGVDINGETTNDNSGNSIALSSDGSKLAIGAPLNDGNGTDSGHVRVYDLSSFLSSNSFVLSNFEIYPNPTSEKVTITLQENLELEKVNIYNTLGQLVKTEKNNIINVTDFAKGNYFFEVITAQGKATKTIIIK